MNSECECGCCGGEGLESNVPDGTEGEAVEESGVRVRPQRVAGGASASSPSP
jgi:hypothetical protein